MIRFAACMLAALFASSSLALADDDVYERSHGQQDLAKLHNMLYQKNCAACHFAYQADLLPSRSWEAIMQPSALVQHFGDNAELDEKDRLAISSFLQANAADVRRTRWSKKLLRGLSKHETPLRITKLAYFVRLHDEVPARLVTGNPKVKSWSNCSACHTEAWQGSFREHEIDIPGDNFWDFD